VNKLKVFIIIGTRPEVIKMAPIIRLMRDDKRFSPWVVSTAQHREMLDDLFELFAIQPDYDLDIMRPNQGLSGVAQKSLGGLTELFGQQHPELVLVEGDTTTALMGALAAFYNKIPVGHVEAGLRTDNRYSPYPEEMNRRLITRLADLHFAPTINNVNNLFNEGVPEEHVYHTGNPVTDSLLWTSNHLPQNLLAEELDAELLNGDRRIIMVTAHRRENWGEPLSNICKALTELTEKNEDVAVVYPVHPHPQVRKMVFPILEDIPRIHLLEPLLYATFVELMKHAYLLLTDSGGVQEEAPSLGKPVLVMRENTERMEAVEAGVACLVGTDQAVIVETAQTLLDNQREYNKMADRQNPFGDGTAANKILAALAGYFSDQ
jgi:UDP-N-acetylglucosamine 2-epimerase (non-hydrolysing)